jgi:Cu2+-exporting ATPase
VTDEDVPGSFCCRGCLEVSRTLDDPAATDADTAREQVATGDADSGAGQTSSDTGESTPDGEETYLHVEGMHCASCEAFLEGRAASVDGVVTADANYPADAMRVTVTDDSATDAETVAEAVAGVGYDATPLDATDPEVDETASETLGRILVGGFFGMMVMLWYVLFLYPTYFGLPSEALLFDIRGSAGGFLLANVWALTSVVLGYTGAPLLRGAYVAVRTRQPNMDLLVSLAAVTAYLYSTVALLVGRVEVYFDVTVVVVVAVTVGSYYEHRVKSRAVAELTDLTRERVSESRLIVENGGDGTTTDDNTTQSVESDLTQTQTEQTAKTQTERTQTEETQTERTQTEETQTVTVPTAELAEGDRLLVLPGERIPTDGEIREGEAGIDESLVTGESLPVRRGPGDAVRGGTLVTDGRLVIAAEADGERTLDRVVSLLWDARGEGGTPQRLADALATLFVPVVLTLGVLAFVVHLALGSSPTGALLTGLAVLVVSCPCALGLATPLAIAAGTRSLLAEGVVLADGSAVEAAGDVDTVAFDKTGTLTTGEMCVTDVVTRESERETDEDCAGVEDREVDTAGAETGRGADAVGAVRDREADTAGAVSRETVLSYAAAVESQSDHPVAEAIVSAAASHPAGDESVTATAGDESVTATSSVTDGGTAVASGSGHTGPTLTAPSVDSFESHPGRGVSGRVDGRLVTVGGASLFTDAQIPRELREAYREADDAGDLAAYVGWTESEAADETPEVHGVIVARDDHRPGWEAALAEIARGEGVAAGADDTSDATTDDTGDADDTDDSDGETTAEEAASESGRRIVVLTGDSGAAADRIAEADAVDEVYAGLPPEAKTETVRRLRQQGTVAMVGDGSNDAPALAAADIGIAVATGTELAADAADAVVIQSDLRAVDSALSILAGTRRRVRENLAWAFGYNAVAVPAAVLGVVTPLLAAVAMATSSLLVVANSTRSLTDDDGGDRQ